MSAIRRSDVRGFTLVEMLVVLGIIAILVALLMPAVMMAVNRARITRMGTEISQLEQALIAYKNDKGDFPPNLRGPADVVIRHIRRCYPKIAPTEFAAVIDMSTTPPSVVPAMQLDEGESLVFWLAGTRNNPRFPFGLTGGTDSEMKRYYEFDERRLKDDDANATFIAAGYPSIPSYQVPYAKDTYYLYIDARTYAAMTSTAALLDPSTGAYAEIDASVTTTITADQVARPYGSSTTTGAAMNPTTFQILCAGQDGDWGNVALDGTVSTTIKLFPSGGGYTNGDRDNITNFSEGQRLDDHVP
jgi:prepilin-type N-terminal cleavage/methylation domain-containing protein